MRVLISGAGIAGPTLAYWLLQYGYEPILIESAPHVRTGGYVIDFWGAGYDVADRMGLLPEIHHKGYVVQEVRVVGPSGKRLAGFPADVFSRMMRGRFVSLPRGDLAASIFDTIKDRVEVIFGHTLKRVEQTEEGVVVTYESGETRQFDLVVGADGLHSRVRQLVYGEQNRFERYLGYKVAAFEIKGYRPRDELVYVMYTQVGRQVVRFAMHDDRTMFLFTFADEDIKVIDSAEAQKAALRERFGDAGWECAKILQALDTCNALYFDRVSQIQMNQQSGLWTRGRVTLVGDAACCVSLLAGQGSALAMVAAYILAGELHRANGDYVAAFTRYQDLFAPFVLKKQKAALRFAGTFAPKSEFALFLRNQIFRLMAVPGIANLAVGRDLADAIVLPDYE
ncbi:MAG: FAD-binding domain [Bryobacteraceae bacterium]